MTGNQLNRRLGFRDEEGAGEAVFAGAFDHVIANAPKYFRFALSKSPPSASDHTTAIVKPVQLSILCI
jgi:hypothetical protein